MKCRGGATKRRKSGGLAAAWGAYQAWRVQGGRLLPKQHTHTGQPRYRLVVGLCHSDACPALLVQLLPCSSRRPYSDSAACCAAASAALACDSIIHASACQLEIRLWSPTASSQHTLWVGRRGRRAIAFRKAASAADQGEEPCPCTSLHRQGQGGGGASDWRDHPKARNEGPTRVGGGSCPGAGAKFKRQPQGAKPLSRFSLGS